MRKSHISVIAKSILVFLSLSIVLILTSCNPLVQNNENESVAESGSQTESESQTEAKEEYTERPPVNIELDVDSEVTFSYYYYGTHSLQLPAEDARTIIETFNTLSFEDKYYKVIYACEFTIGDKIFKYVPKTRDEEGFLQILEDKRSVRLDEETEAKIAEIYEKYYSSESNSTAE